MGRRALRPIDPSLDLSDHLYAVEDLPQPLDADSFFGRTAPLEIEMGSGKGLFMSSATEQHPERNFLGIEIARKYARYCAARLARHGRTNGKMISGDGLRVFREYLPESCAAAVHVNFPDPWWKKRHFKRRVMKPAFVHDIQRVLQPGGRLHFWTDVRDYYESTLELIAAESRLQGPIQVPVQQADHDLDYRTHFERRMRLHQEDVYRAEFVRE